jgi:hypothetical protein
VMLGKFGGIFFSVDSARSALGLRWFPARVAVPVVRRRGLP